MTNSEHKNILIVGASSGIGHALARRLSSENTSLFTISRRTPEGIQSTHLSADITDAQADIASFLPDVLHGVVYCPGSINLKPFQRLSADDFLRDFRINTLGAVQVLQAALPALKKSGNAGVVLFSTVAVHSGMSFHASISAAKGAVEGLTRSLAAEFAPFRIRVNAIAPSLTETPLAASLLSSPEKHEAAAKRHPLGRVGTADEIAAMAAFLLSEQAGWITGQVIGVDGGKSVIS